MGGMMADVNKDSMSLQKAVQCCIDQLGNIKSHSIFINNEEQLDWMKLQLELMQLIRRASELAVEEAVEKQKAAIAD